MKWYLIRHGQTDWNLKGKIQGKTDIALDETGICQAECLAEGMEKIFEKENIRRIYSSPLKRAYQTARQIAGKKDVSVITLDGLREVDFGLWEGMTWTEIEAEYKEDFELWKKNPSKHTPTGGELRSNCQKRCEDVVETILNREKNEEPKSGAAVVVAHGGILVFLISYLLRNRKEKQEIIVKNASISSIEYDPDTETGVLLELNNTEHIRENRKKD